MNGETRVCVLDIFFLRHENVMTPDRVGTSFTPHSRCFFFFGQLTHFGCCSGSPLLLNGTIPCHQRSVNPLLTRQNQREKLFEWQKCVGSAE